MRLTRRLLPALLLAGRAWAQFDGDSVPEIEEALRVLPNPVLYAAPILAGGTNERVYLTAMDDAGEKAVIERSAEGLWSRTEIRLLERNGDSWTETSLLSRPNGTYVGGVTLSALALSGDGRYLVYNWMEDVEAPASRVIKAMDLGTGEQFALGPGRGGRLLDDERRTLVRVVLGSDWFRSRPEYRGGNFDDVFPDSLRRCAGKDAASVRIRSGRLTARKENFQPLEYDLKSLSGWSSAIDWRLGYQQTAGSKDCSRLIVKIEESLDSTSFSFFGPSTRDKRARLVELGAAQAP